MTPREVRVDRIADGADSAALSRHLRLPSAGGWRPLSVTRAPVQPGSERATPGGRLVVVAERSVRPPGGGPWRRTAGRRG